MDRTGQADAVAAGPFNADGLDATIRLGPGEQRSIPLRIGTERVGAQADAPAIDRHRDVHVLVGIDPDNHRLRFVQVRHAVRHCRLLGLRRWLVRAGGQDCDGPFVRQAPIGSRPIRSASYRMIRRWAMTDRSKRGHEVSQLEGQAITHRHPPVSPSDTDRRPWCTTRDLGQ